MLDFEVQRCTRRCAKTQRELQPGEVFYSVLMAEGAQVVRYDYAAEAWEGEPDHALGSWKSRIPEPNAAGMHWAPSDVMLNYLEELETHADQRDERYVLALLLLRRRIVRSEDVERDEAGRETLILYSPRNEREYRVDVVVPTRERVQDIQERFSRLFFASAAM
jgi:hypothetical protein